MQKQQELLAADLSELALPSRISKRLHAAGLHTVQDLLSLSREQFLRIEGISVGVSMRWQAGLKTCCGQWTRWN